MDNFEDEEFYKQHPEVVKMFRNGMLNKMLQEVKCWKREGKTKEEVLPLIDRRVLIEEDVEKIFEEEEDYDLDNEANSDIEILETEEKSKETDNENRIVYLSNEELIDYENQPFSTNDEEENREMEESITLNGIIEPIIVRPYQGKYQILSGHRRRKCGRNLGMNKFPCYIREKDDEEAKLYLVDTNLVSRKKIKPTERAKAYLLKKEALKNGNLREKVENDIANDNTNLNVRKLLIAENKVSNGTMQRYLRVNYLNNDLKEALDSNKISVKTAEQLSFLEEEQQNMISDWMKKNHKKITESQAKRLKENARRNSLYLETLDSILNKKTDSDKISIMFLKSELEGLFEDLENKSKIKKELIEIYKKYKNEEVH